MDAYLCVNECICVVDACVCSYLYSYLYSCLASRRDRRLWVPLLCVLCLHSVVILDESRHLMTDWRHADTENIMPCIASCDHMICVVGFRDHTEVLMYDVIT